MEEFELPKCSFYQHQAALNALFKTNFQIAQEVHPYSFLHPNKSSTILNESYASSEKSATGESVEEQKVTEGRQTRAKAAQPTTDPPPSSVPEPTPLGREDVTPFSSAENTGLDTS